MPDNRASAGGLLKVLGVLFGATMVVSGTIGAGILRTPGDVAASLPHAGWYLGVWVAGGVYALCGAMTMAELGAMLPASGGQYVFARRALGEYAGFVIGWTDWISSSAAVSASSIALGELSGVLWPQLPVSPTSVAVITTLAFGAVHWVGVRSGDVSTQIIGALKAVTLLAVAVACFAANPLAASTRATTFPAGLAMMGALVLAMQGVLYTYDGWTGLVYFSGEVRDPRQIPRAMALGVATVTLVYVSLAAAFLHTLGIPGLAGEKFAARAAAVGLFGSVGDRIVSAVMALSFLGNVGAILMQASRVPFAMSQDGLLPKVVSRVNRGGTPDVSLLGSVGIAVLLIATGSFESVLALAAFFYVMQYGVSFTSLFVLRVREPDLPRPYRAIGYPVIPAIVLVGATAFVVGSFFGDTTNTLHSVVVIALSYPLYRGIAWARRRAQRS
ncbi:MAG TPA: APC family permease [Gemmatimonadaceae bacterium]